MLKGASALARAGTRAAPGARFHQVNGWVPCRCDYSISRFFVYRCRDTMQLKQPMARPAPAQPAP